MSAPLQDPDGWQPRLLATISTILILAITGVHFVTDTHDVAFHNVYRRLNYIPIVLGAFAYGLRGGVGFGVFAGVAYVPHAFFAIHLDPAPTVDKVLEIVLYVAIGALTGWLVERQREARRKLERSLEERDALETQLVRAGKLSALGELTSGLAHEIRNPLASISGSADALADEFDEDHRKYPMVRVLMREIERLNKVVSEFLDFARPAPAERAMVDLRDLIDEVVSLSERRAADRGITITTSGASQRVEADRDQATQVVLNLLLNAFDACEESPDPHVDVQIRSREVGGQAYRCVVVADNGPGISEEFRERIFDPYFTTREDGTGLGLSISNRIMDAHDGFLDVTAGEEGTTFFACFRVTDD